MAQDLNELKNMTLSGDAELDDLIEKWVKWDRNPKTKKEILKLIEAKDWGTLKLRLLKRIAFGTAGLRAEMRAGFDSMNDLVVVQTAQGLCAYLKEQYTDKSSWSERGIVFGYDARHNSKRFAELSALVFLKNNFRVYLFKRYAATPFVPFAIKKLNCLAGVQVTASHNPKKDNGYKVYWTNGAQIISPHDSGIHKAILKNLEPAENYWAIDEATLWSNALLSDPYEQVEPAYYDALLKTIPDSLLKANATCDLSFAYTAMHGIGYTYVSKAFEQVNMRPVVPVVQQVEPDPEFPTTPMPNPEEGKTSLDLAIKTATDQKCNIILANDPDADRLAVAEFDTSNKKYKLFNGNELGALLGWWALEMHKMRHPNADLSKCVMIASTVSSKILKSMAANDGFIFCETLTGFKWMANKAIEKELAGMTVLFAFEEAIGFMISTNVPDKDGVSAAAHVATMARYLHHEKGMTLQQKLTEIYKIYGYHTSICSYVTCSDQLMIQQIFNRLRTFNNGQANTYPRSILNGKYEIEHVRDLTTGYDSSAADKRAILPVSSSSQMITFTFKNGVVITLRTSGTEPKMKYYAEMCGKPADKGWDQLTQTLQDMEEALVNEFYEPEKNQLQRKSAD
ncbi:glucose 1,6-bisphosphate synthase [Drosophila novamexicana]|uniref:glucose 1,6-bisphosphate synthase n=1 Tax=Drosophila novamexicana TaxID=47314 RepID=UPI0011E599E0|nr:glucose 1,6-bisphosphate synthase [Drosophila novamexicana]XP_030559957.1 glucose 1,6-bisphosphate synthase [Drosophila novamexicana]XP_030559958.1 glucose 1,6-bisphosphate synthase [Drosophila novamexicana]